MAEQDRHAMKSELEQMRAALRATGLKVCEQTRQGSELPFFTTMLFAGGTPDDDSPPLVSGQGITAEASLLSAYGELFERLQNNFLISGYRHACASESGYERLPERCRQRLDQQGGALDFFIAPDEAWIEAKQFASAGNNDLMPRAEIPASGAVDDEALLCVPFYSAFDGKVRHCPVERMLFTSGSTGCAAGRTLEQAITKALLEICERHLFHRIFLDEPPLPLIPRELLRNTEAARIIEAIEERGASVTLFDGSLGAGFPVVAVLLIDRQQQRYNANLGAAATLAEAVIGAMKELFDGCDDFHGLPLSGLDDPFAEVTDDERHRLRFANYYAAKASSTGLWPKSLFASHKPAPERLPEIWSDKLAARPVETLLERFASWTDALCIRDVSWLGIPSVYCYAPGLSEVNYATGRNELAMLLELRAESERLQSSGDVEMTRLRRIMELERNLKRIALPAPVRVLTGFACPNLPGSARRREAALLAALARLFGDETPRDASLLDRCVGDGKQLSDEGCDAAEIDSQMRRLYPDSVVDLAARCRQAPSEFIKETLRETELPEDESACDGCHFLKTVETARRLQKRQIANLPDQRRLTTLFPTGNRHEP
ncbi:MAG: YcaO-like family protein [Chlorobiaceae bacterium]|nr:YcaO-like family protein [Chlorobiaceae bacterium]